MQATNMSIIHWWVEASFVVHPDLKSHTGSNMLLGKGSAIDFCRKQKMNTHSSTEAELVGVNDVVTCMI